MIQPIPLTGQCPHCGAPAWRLAYHSRYTLRSGQTVLVFRCRQCRKTFCDRFGTAFYDLKTPEEKVKRAIQQGLEGLCPEAVARVEGVHPTTVQRWVELASAQAQAADQKGITAVFLVAVRTELLKQLLLSGAYEEDRNLWRAQISETAARLISEALEHLSAGHLNNLLQLENLSASE